MFETCKIRVNHDFIIYIAFPKNIYLGNKQKYLLVINLINFSGHRTLARLDQLFGEYSGSSESEHETIGDVAVGERQNSKNVFQIMV